jgi:biopolymer transport protein ExbD
MPEMKEGGVNVTPLIDIVMCMIVFFMFVARIGISTGADSSIAIPETVLGQQIADMGNTLTLNVKQGTGDEPAITTLVKAQVTEVRLTERKGGKLETPLADLLRELHQRNGEFKVIIRGDKEMPYRCLEPVLAACSQAGVSNVSFNTKVATVSP